MSEQLPHTYKLCYSTLHKQGGIIPNTNLLSTNEVMKMSL